MLVLRSLTVIAIAALPASAQLGTLVQGLSSNCSSSAVSLLSSSFSRCAGLTALVPALTTTTNVITAFEGFLDAICSQNCTQSDVDSAVAVVDNGCSEDIANNNTIIATLRSAIDNYYVERRAFCLESTANSTYCVTELLTSIQNATGTDLTFTNTIDLLGDPSSVVSSLSGSNLCTDCTHGLVSALGDSSLTDLASRECGSSFADGQIPGTLALADGSSDSSDGGGSNSSATGSGTASRTPNGSGSASGSAPAQTSQPTSAASSLSAGLLSTAIGAVVLGVTVLVV